METTMIVSENAKPQEIMAGWQTVDIAVVEQIKEYDRLVVTSEEIPYAKSVLADLNNLDKRLDSIKKDVKNKIMQEYNQFEPLVKGTREKVQTVASGIKKQLEVLEEERRANKRKEIRAYFDNVAGRFELSHIADQMYGHIYRSEWENASCTMKKYKEGIETGILMVSKDLEAVAMISNDDNKEILMKVYLETFDMSKVTEKKNELNAYAEAIVERSKAESQKQVQRIADQVQAERQRMMQQEQKNMTVQRVESARVQELEDNDEDDFMAVAAPSIPQNDVSLVLKGISDEALEDLKCFMEMNEIIYVLK